MVSNTNCKIIVSLFFKPYRFQLLFCYWVGSTKLFCLPICIKYPTFIENVLNGCEKYASNNWINAYLLKIYEIRDNTMGWKEQENDYIYTLVGLSCVSLHRFVVWQIRHNCNDYCPSKLWVISQFGSRLICRVWWLGVFRIRRPMAIFQRHVRHPWSRVQVRTGNIYV